MVPKQDLGFREVEGGGGGMVHGRWSVKLLSGTEREIPCHDRC